MRSQLKQIFMLVILFVIFCFSNKAMAVKASRIELKDGKVYENVIFSVDHDYKVITIQEGNWKREVSFPDIAHIYDEDGNEVTEAYLGDYFVPSEKGLEKTKLSIERPLYRKYRKKPFDFGINLGTNYSFPLGDYYEGTKSGIGFDGNIIIPITKEVAIRLTVSKSGAKDDLTTLFPDVDIIQDNMNFNVWRFLVSGQFYSWPRWKTGGRILYYGYTGLGVITHSVSGSAIVREPFTGQEYVLYGTGENDTKFATTFGGGIIPMISERVGIDIGISADIVFVSRNYYYPYDYSYGSYGQYAFIIDVKVGLVGLF
jgi:hypothetical protein